MQASTGQPMQLAQAYQHCLDIARNHYENFPTASRLLKADLRPAVAAIYAFARHADDLADEGDALPETRIKQLDAWEILLERCETGEVVDHPVFMALSDAITKHHLPIEELHNLLIAFRMDVTLHAYATFDELRFYCKHSANPVGRLMLALHGIHDSEAQRCSDNICTALQLINFWQDLSIDLPRGRCYLPQTWLQENGIESQQMLDGTVSVESLRPVLMQALLKTGELLENGVPLLNRLPFRLRLQIASTIHGGRRMLSKVENLDNPLQQRASLSAQDWRGMMLPVLKDTLFPSFAQKRETA
ncbi:squalene synthase HpnC [Mariprofundus ferrinatatus]|uniref:Squalene synthase HpnC n=1 Tax=Mariprofundus ferrinatatus TaxID=1921087 RepID=A0A2K8L3T4_9PROT|nr:squalene synthase HpnC [Mariprofundus ferrinatatus]ATX81947.1 squalene synthase HpnC [Mariprofundus ferrinatatus]